MVSWFHFVKTVTCVYMRSGSELWRECLWEVNWYFLWKEWPVRKWVLDLNCEERHWRVSFSVLWTRRSVWLGLYLKSGVGRLRKAVWSLLWKLWPLCIQSLKLDCAESRLWRVADTFFRKLRLVYIRDLDFNWTVASHWRVSWFLLWEPWFVVIGGTNLN
jgi:hypothetical protein